MCAKKSNNSTLYNKRHAGRVLSSDEKRKITQSKQATKNAHNPFDSFTQKRHMAVKGQRNQTVKLSQAHTRDLQSRRDTLLVELRNKDRSSNFNNGDSYERKPETNRPNSAANYIAAASALAHAPTTTTTTTTTFSTNSSVSSSSYSAAASASSQQGSLKLDADQQKLYEKSLKKLQKRDLKRKRFTLDEEEGGSMSNGSAIDDYDDHDGGDMGDVRSSNKKKKVRDSAAASSTFGATLGDIDEAFDRNMMSTLNKDDYQDEDGEDVEFRNEFAERANKRLEKLQALENRSKTNEDRYLEIIRKSKLHKIEKQKKKEEQMDTTDEMNDNFNTLLTHLSMRPKREDEPENEAGAADEDEYDRAIRSFSFQSKVTPDVIKKTDKETAEERKQRLQKLEEERLARMNTSAATVAKKQSGVESLDYDEYLSDNEEDIGSDDEVDPTVRLGVPDDEPASTNSDDDADQNGDAKEEENGAVANANSMSDEVGSNIPYVIEAPANYADLKKLVEDRSPAEVSIIFSRIRELNDARLGHEQKLKLQNFFSLVIKHYKGYVAQIEKSHAEDKHVDFSMLNAIYDHIFGLSELMPKHAISEFKNHLRAMHTDLLNRLSTGAESFGYPSSSDLLFLKLISNIFPVTDFQHSVSTPANVYIHQCLADCQIRSLRDVASGLYLCATAIHYNQEARRFSPEVVTFLTNVLKTVTATSDEIQTDNMEDGANKINWLRLKKSSLKHETTKTLSFNKFIINKPTLEHKLSLVRCAVHLVKQYSAIFNQEFTSYAEVFEPVQSALQAILNKCIKSDHSMHAEINQVITHIQTVSEKCIKMRKRLLYLDVKPQAIPQFTPLVIGTLKGKIIDDDKFRLHTKIMTQKVKKAQRSAIREIRKDNAFLARAREEVVANEMKQRKEKYKEIINDLQSEKHQQYQLDFGNRQLSRDMKAARKGRKTGNQPVNRRK